MIHPDVETTLAAVIDTFDRFIAPEVSDPYAASLCLTVSQLLRAVRARVAHEGEALHEDNADLGAVLVGLRGRVDAELAAKIDSLLAAGGGVGRVAPYPSVARLQERAIALREVLVACIEAIPDRHDPARAEVRRYLTRQLDRQRPWHVDAFTGPRR